MQDTIDNLNTKLENKDKPFEFLADLKEFSDTEKQEIGTIILKMLTEKAKIDQAFQEMLYIELGSQLLQGKDITDIKTRLGLTVTDEELQTMCVREIISYIDKHIPSGQYTSQAMSNLGFYRRDNFEKAIQKRAGMHPKDQDGCIGPKTIKAIKKKLMLENMKKEKVIINTDEANKRESINKNINITNETLKKIQDNVPRKLYADMLTQKTGKKSDGLLCAGYVGYCLNILANQQNKSLNLRTLGDSWELAYTCGSPYFIQEDIGAITNPGELKKTIKSSAPGTMITLKYDHSYFKHHPVTHTIISIGGGYFLHIFGGKIETINMNEVIFTKDKEGFACKIANNDFHITSGSKKIVPNFDAMPSVEATNLVPENNMSIDARAQKIADTYQVTKEYALISIMQQHPNLKFGQIYKKEDLAVSLYVKKNPNRADIVSETTYSLNDIIAQAKDPKFRDFVNTMETYRKELGLSENDFKALLICAVNEIGQESGFFSRKTIEDWYTNGTLLPDSWVRWGIEFANSIRTGKKDAKPSSFGPFQVNKYAFMTAIKDQTDFPDFEQIFLEKFPDKKTIVDKIKNGSVNEQEVEKLLREPKCALFVGWYFFKDNQKKIKNKLIKHNANEINADDLELTSIFAYNHGLDKTRKGIFQQNLLWLASEIGIDITKHCQPNKKGEKKFIIDGDIGNVTILLFADVIDKIGKKGVFTFAKNNTGNITGIKDTKTGEHYSFADHDQMKRLFTILYQQAKKKPDGTAYYPGFSYKKLKKTQGKTTHLEYAFRFLNVAKETNEKHIVNLDIEKKSTNPKVLEVLSKDREAGEAVRELAGPAGEKYKGKIIKLTKAKLPKFPVPENLNGPNTNPKQGGYIVWQGQGAEWKNKKKQMPPVGSDEYNTWIDASLINTMMQSGDFGACILSNGVICEVGQLEKYPAGAGRTAMLNGDALINQKGIGIEIAGATNPETKDIYPPTQAQLDSMLLYAKYLQAKYNIPEKNITHSRQVADKDKSQQPHTDFSVLGNDDTILRAMGITDPVAFRQKTRYPKNSQEKQLFIQTATKRISLLKQQLQQADSIQMKKTIEKSIEYWEQKIQEIGNVV